MFVVVVVSTPTLLRSRHRDTTRKLTKILKNYKNDCFQKYLPNLIPTADSNYPLLQASRKLTRPPQIIPSVRCPEGKWARSPIQKVNLFASHLTNVFKPYSSTIAAEITELALSLPDVSSYWTFLISGSIRFS